MELWALQASLCLIFGYSMYLLGPVVSALPSLGAELLRSPLYVAYAFAARWEQAAYQAHSPNVAAARNLCNMLIRLMNLPKLPQKNMGDLYEVDEYDAGSNVCWLPRLVWKTPDQALPAAPVDTTGHEMAARVVEPLMAARRRQPLLASGPVPGYEPARA